MLYEVITSIRAEALSALAQGVLDAEVKQALIEEVRTQEYTTAYLAADILGAKGVTEVKETYCLKPMNCPHHHRIYAARMRSYRDLPLRP